MPLVECVPNFSEGRNKKTIDAIAEAISQVEGVTLLDVDPGQSTNRTVITFVGEPESVLEAAYAGIAKAAALIDMRQHKGAHSRIGATDVCPFIPVADITMAECVELARRLAKRVGEELKIPVYLYADAAAKKERYNLADIRQGEYEALSERIQKGFTPDFGPPEFNPQSGATVIGARPFLIAYNVNLNTKSQKLANEIALNIREAGRAKRDSNGNIMKDAQGVSLKAPGTLKACKAVGWYVEEYKQAQISINLVDYAQTSIEQAFDECVQQADKLGLRVTGSEVVGMIPLAPMLQAGKYYLLKQGRSAGVPESELVQTAILSLGLSDIALFDPQKKIIEYAIASSGKLLRTMPVCDFVDELSSESPAPGGGSVAALCGALSAALASMVANLTYGKKGFTDLNDEMSAIAAEAQTLKAKFLQAIDADTDAFNKIAEARRLPKDSEKSTALRNQAIDDANKTATLIPYSVLDLSYESLQLAAKVSTKGNPNTLSDAGVAGLTARAAGEGAFYNVLINLREISDQNFKKDLHAKAERRINTLRELSRQLHNEILAKLK